jgi:hypothetical protein
MQNIRNYKVLDNVIPAAKVQIWEGSAFFQSGQVLIRYN